MGFSTVKVWVFAQKSGDVSSMDLIIDDKFRVTSEAIFWAISDLFQGSYQRLPTIQHEHMDTGAAEDTCTPKF